MRKGGTRILRSAAPALARAQSRLCGEIRGHLLKRVDEARASQGLPPIGDSRGKLTIGELDALAGQMPPDAPTLAGTSEVAEKGAGDDAIPIEEARSGDVLHMWGMHRGKRRPTHCGIVTEPGLVLHAEEVVGSCISRYKGDNRFLQRVIGAYRLE